MPCRQVRNGFLSVRVWFPAVAGVLTSGDQEVIIMCKPPAPPPPASNTPGAGAGEGEGRVRVAGQLDTPSRRLSYEVALYSQLEDGEEEGSSVSGAVEIGGDILVSALSSTCFLGISCIYMTCDLACRHPAPAPGQGGRCGRGGGGVAGRGAAGPGPLAQVSTHIYIYIYNIYNWHNCHTPPAPPSPAPQATWCWWLAAAACPSSRTWCRGRPAPCRAPSSRPGPRPS